MLNFYATANNPRWQAVGIEGSDADVASVFGNMADYIWNLSDGSTLYSNAINDSICKSLGYILLTVDPDQDNGMGEVVLKQPEPFDIYVDPKSRDMLLRDAAFVLIRKVLPRNHLIKLFPDYKRKIKAASSDEASDFLTKMSDPSSISIDNLVQLYRFQNGGNPQQVATPAQPSEAFTQTKNAQQVPSPMGVMPSGQSSVDTKTFEDKIMDTMIGNFNSKNPWK